MILNGGLALALALSAVTPQPGIPVESPLATSASTADPVVSPDTEAGLPEVDREARFTLASSEVRPGGELVVEGVCRYLHQPAERLLVAYYPVGNYDPQWYTLTEFSMDGSFTGTIPVPADAAVGEYELSWMCISGDVVFGFPVDGDPTFRVVSDAPSVSPRPTVTSSATPGVSPVSSSAVAVASGEGSDGGVSNEASSGELAATGASGEVFWALPGFAAVMIPAGLLSLLVARRQRVINDR